MKSDSEYTGDSVQILRHGEHIRLRPDMYVGPLPRPTVINRLVEEALCLSVDEAAFGTCTEIAVSFDPSGTVTIRDNGPGLPAEPYPDGRHLAEVILTEAGACLAAKRSENVKGACCHYGMVVVNYLSEWLRVRNFRDGVCWSQEYRAGKPQAPFRPVADCSESGLELSFRPDAELLGPQEFDGEALTAWLSRTGIKFESLVVSPSNRTLGNPLVMQFTGVGPAQSWPNTTPS